MTWIERTFPLAAGRYRVTSNRDRQYNCIAWAANITSEWWEDTDGYTWPAPVRSGLIESLVGVFTKLGFERCADGDVAFDPSFEKVALYSLDGEWTHAARQVPSGKWTSKLGAAEDIEHDEPACLCGDTYGDVYCIMRRPIR